MIVKAKLGSKIRCFEIPSFLEEKFLDDIEKHTPIGMMISYTQLIRWFRHNKVAINEVLI